MYASVRYHVLGYFRLHTEYNPVASPECDRDRDVIAGFVDSVQSRVSRAVLLWDKIQRRGFLYNKDVLSTPMASNMGG